MLLCHYRHPSHGEKLLFLTRSASSYKQGPSPHAPQSPWKFAPKDDGLGAKVRTQANV